MSGRSEGSVAVITGCSSGIGRATGVLLAQRGWRVFATARRAETISDLAGERIIPLCVDVTDESSMVAAVDEVVTRAGRIDAVVNNAGYGQGGPLEEVRGEDIRRQFETNTFGPLRLAQLVLPVMRAQGSGRIVNVSTMGGRVSMPFIGPYCGSKFALEALSDALRLETRPFGVRVILVEPGSVKTNFRATATRESERLLTDPMSPYRDYVERFARLMERATRGAPPERVARVIHRALTARRPRARYVATPDARLMLAIALHLPDQTRDAVWSRLLGLREGSKGGMKGPVLSHEGLTHEGR